MLTRALRLAALVLLAVHLYAMARVALSPRFELPSLPGGSRLNVVALMLFGLCHASLLAGGKSALRFFALSAVISWGFEQVGVATGLVYGAYRYSDQLGPKLGHVPVLIPIAWFAMMYPSHVIANLGAEGRAQASPPSWARALLLSVAAAFVMTAWDLPMDPTMSAAGHWVWDPPGPYFGVPLHNFAGWLVTTFSVFAAYRLTERRWPGTPRVAETRAFASLPVVAYGAFALTYVLVADPPALRIVALFAMGPPVLWALLGLFRGAEGRHQGGPPPASSSGLEVRADLPTG